MTFKLNILKFFISFFSFCFQFGHHVTRSHQLELSITIDESTPFIGLCFLLYVVTDCFDQLISKKSFRDFYTVQCLGYILVVVTTLLFSRENSMMLGWREKDDQQFLQVTSYKYSALNCVAKLFEVLACLFVFVFVM